MKNKFTTIVLSLLSLSAAKGAIYTTGHGDIGIAYEAGEFDLHVHLHSGAVVDGVTLGADAEYETGDLYVYVPNPSISRPGSSAFDPIGITAGQPLWLIPAVQDPDKPFFGVGAEELTAAEWTGNIQLKLTAISGSGADAGGEISLWNNDTFGSPNFYWSSVDGLSIADTLSVIPGSHAHYNIAFTQPGIYDVTVEATGTNVDDGLIFGTATYQFAVAATPVPEPTTGFWGLTALGLAGARRFRNTRRPL